MLAVSEPLGVLEDLVGGGGERQGQLQGVPHQHAQTQVLLHVLQGQLRREPALDDGCGEGGVVRWGRDMEGGK